MTEATDFYTGNRIHDPADAKLVVRFRMEPRLDHAKSAELGREVFQEVEFITILIPGDKTLTVNRRVMPADRLRFEAQYKHFKANLGQALQGTPLSVLQISESQRRELEHFHIGTIEQLAEVNDNFASQMSGVMGLKLQAQKYLQVTKERAPEIKLMKELEQRDNQLAALQDQLNKLAAMLPVPPAKEA